jgi:hypothetical protein
MQLEEFSLRLMEAHARPGENISMPDITVAPFSPDIIAAFIRMIAMNPHLQPENSLDIETILKNSPISAMLRVESVF